MFLYVFSIFLSILDLNVGIFVFIFSIIINFLIYFYYKNYLIIISDFSITIKSGIISRNEEEIFKKNISKIKINKPLFLLLVNHGYVKFFDFSGQETCSIIVSNPNKLKNLLRI